MTQRYVVDGKGKPRPWPKPTHAALAKIRPAAIIGLRVTAMASAIGTATNWPKVS